MEGSFVVLASAGECKEIRCQTMEEVGLLGLCNRVEFSLSSVTICEKFESAKGCKA